MQVSEFDLLVHLLLQRISLVLSPDPIQLVARPDFIVREEGANEGLAVFGTGPETIGGETQPVEVIGRDGAGML